MKKEILFYNFKNSITEWTREYLEQKTTKVLLKIKDDLLAEIQDQIDYMPKIYVKSMPRRIDSVNEVKRIYKMIIDELEGRISEIMEHDIINYRYQLHKALEQFNAIITDRQGQLQDLELKEELRNEIEEAKQFPDVKSYVMLDKSKINYNTMTYEQMIQGTKIGKLYCSMSQLIINTLKDAGINKYSITDLFSGHVKMTKGTVEQTLQFAIDYYIRFKSELKQATNVLEFQQVLEKYRDIFCRYGEPQVGMMNFNSSFGKSIKSHTDQYTMPLGTAIRDTIVSYITRFNTYHGLNTYKFREPIEQSKLYEIGFTSYEEFYEYAKTI